VSECTYVNAEGVAGAGQQVYSGVHREFVVDN
jgi:hypothetical protein